MQHLLFYLLYRHIYFIIQYESIKKALSENKIMLNNGMLLFFWRSKKCKKCFVVSNEWLRFHTQRNPTSVIAAPPHQIRRTPLLVTISHPFSPLRLVCLLDTGWALWVCITCNVEWSGPVWRGSALSWRHKPVGWGQSSHGTWKSLCMWQSWAYDTLSRRSRYSS